MVELADTVISCEPLSFFIYLFIYFLWVYVETIILQDIGEAGRT